MKRQATTKQPTSQKTERAASYYVTQRLDESLPLETEEWKRAEQLIMQLCEFAPISLITEMVNAIAIYADDQAHKGYVLGQEDLIKVLKQQKAAAA
jgi:hypothetical protein